MLAVSTTRRTWPAPPGPHQTTPIKAGYYGAVVYFRVPKPPPGNANVTMNMTPLDEAGRNLPTIAHSAEAAWESCTPIAVCAEILAEIQGQPVRDVRSIVIVGDFEPDEELAAHVAN